MILYETTEYGKISKMWCRMVSHHILWYYMMPYHIILYHIISYNSIYLTISYQISSNDIIWHLFWPRQSHGHNPLFLYKKYTMLNDYLILKNYMFIRFMSKLSKRHITRTAVTCCLGHIWMSRVDMKSLELRYSLFLVRFKIKIIQSGLKVSYQILHILYFLQSYGWKHTFTTNRFSDSSLYRF